jgi:hypothetical protein
MQEKRRLRDATGQEMCGKTVHREADGERSPRTSDVATPDFSAPAG